MARLCGLFKLTVLVLSANTKKARATGPGLFDSLSLHESVQHLLDSVDIKPIEVHHLGEGGREVFDKLLFRIFTGIEFGQGS